MLSQTKCELAVESSSLKSYGKSIQRNISKTIELLDIAYKTKNVSFLPHNWYPWWTGPGRPGRNALLTFISQTVQKVQTWNFVTRWTLVLKRWCQIKKKHNWFRNYACLVRKVNCAIFSNTSAYNSDTTSNTKNLIISHGRSSQDLSESLQFCFEKNFG